MNQKIGPNEDFKQATHYFKRRFQRLNRSDIKEIYPHFTNATDTNLLRHIMGSVTGTDQIYFFKNFFKKKIISIF